MIGDDGDVRTTKTFSGGDGGPLAVDEEKTFLLNLSTAIGT